LRRTLFVAATVLALAPSFAIAQQQRTITGRVVAEGGTEPLSGATVQIVGTTAGTITAEDGRYRLVATEGALQLSVRRIGFKRRVVDVAADRNAVDVSLERDALKLEELVITGQGTAVARQNLANDVASVDAEALTKVQTTSFEGALQGKIPGANIQMNSGAPGGGGQVQIRGITSINGSSDPLWVVDGVIVSNDVLNPGITAVTRSSGLQPVNQDNGVNRIADLNLNDIERIEVLKGASASSIYGARAANGVIVITTKRGTAGPPRFNITQRAGTYNQLRTLGSRVFTRDAAIAQFLGTGKLFGTDTTRLLGLYGDGAVHDNEKNFFGETPYSYETSVNASGGGETTRYFGSVLNKFDGGIMPNTGAKRQSLRVNVSQTASKKLTLDLRTAVMHSSDRRGLSNNDNTGTSPYVVFSTTPNFFDLRPKGGVYPLNPFERSNPFQTMALSKIRESTDRFIVGGTATYQLFASQTQTAQVRVDGGADRLNQNDNIYTPPELQFEPADGLAGTTALTDGLVQNANVNASLTHTLTPKGGLLSTTTSVGVQREVRDVEFANIVNRDLLAGQENINRGTTPLLQQNRQPTKVFAMFGQEEVLLFNERLLLTGGVRAERNTNNGDVDKLYYFPKASASYRLPKFAFVEEFKIRSAWGKSGNQPLYPQKYTNLTNTVYNNVNALRVALGAGDPNIKPETQTEIEGGFDASVFGGRATLSMTVFDKSIDDLIIQPTFAPSSGFTNYFTNGASLQNRGIESMLQVTPLRFRRGEWNSTVIYQKVKAKITDLSVPTFRQGGFALFLGQYQVEAGKSPTQIVGLVPTVANPNVSAAAIVGDATPDYQMSFNNEVSFGPFHASALLDWRHGGDVINLTTFLYDAAHNSADWDTKGKERFALQGKDTRPYVEDGSFVKLREVSLSYRVPQSFVQRTLRGQVRTAGISFSGRNLLMNSAYKGVDPEVSNFGNQALNRNVDVAPFPPSRSFFLSLDLGF
jgi:TonB-dependent starch-binding outer membrane protein SusC